MEIRDNSLAGSKKFNQLEFDFESTEKKENKEEILKVSNWIWEKITDLFRPFAYFLDQTNVTEKIKKILTRESEDLEKNMWNIRASLEWKWLKWEELEDSIKDLEKLKTYWIVKLEELSEKRPEYKEEFSYLIENISKYRIDSAYEYFQDFRPWSSEKQNISFSQKIKWLLNMIELTEKFK